MTSTGKRKQGGNVLLKSLGFSIGLILAFTLVANLLPQVEGEAPVDQEIDLTTLTMDDFVSLGSDIFKGKGTCTLCHNSMGRAPDILKLNMVEIATQRLKDTHYKGKGITAADYLIESMIDPGIYVVKGFGKKGSNDTISPMPAVDKAPIQLTHIEIDAVIAFMQSKDGNEVTVSLPTATASIKKEDSESKQQKPITATTAEQALNKYTCTACHAVLDSQSPVGPELKSVGRRLTEKQIRDSIIDPNAVVAKGFAPMMPTDFADKMTARELEMVVKFLAGQKG